MTGGADSIRLHLMNALRLAVDAPGRGESLRDERTQSLACVFSGLSADEFARLNRAIQLAMRDLAARADSRPPTDAEMLGASK